MKSRLDNQQGFTLVEIIITIVILVVGLSALMGLFPVGLKASHRGATLSTVAMLGEMKMAEVHYVGYDNLTSIEGISAVPGNSGAKLSFAAYSDYQWHLNISSTGISDLVQAIAWIYWNDEGRERNEKFLTFIADYAD